MSIDWGTRPPRGHKRVVDAKIQVYLPEYETAVRGTVVDIVIDGVRLPYVVGEVYGDGWVTVLGAAGNDPRRGPRGRHDN